MELFRDWENDKNRFYVAVLYAEMELDRKLFEIITNSWEILIAEISFNS